MSDRILKDLDFDYYNRLFRKTAGDGYGLAVCTRTGKPLWISAEPASERMTEAIESLQKKNTLTATPEDSEDKYISLNGHGTLLCHPIRSNSDEPIGWLAALTTQNGNGQPAKDTQDGMEALNDIGLGIVREYELNSELENLTEELSERYEELNLVYDMGRLGKSNGMKNEIFNQMVKLCVKYMDADMVFFVKSKKKQVFYTVNSHHENVKIELLIKNIQNKLFSFVASAKECVIINEKNDYRRHLIFSGLPYRILIVPIFIDKRVKAILVILRHQEKPDFSNSDRNLVEAMASEAGILLQNQNMYFELQLFTEQMAASLIESIDAKDPYTRGHSDRVNLFSVEIGKIIGLSENNLHSLYWASLLHDLGKIGVPDTVLTKPGRLTADEFAIIKMHPERGYAILKHVKRLREALPGIRHHHERLDGNGYPHELVGEEIPLHGRIIAVADTYDAITSTRSYRPARNNDEAMNRIRKAAGTQLDPEIVDAWIRLVESRPDIFQAREAV